MYGDSDVCVSLAAARAALHRFIQSRDSSQRERDLLKSVKVCFVVSFVFSLPLSLYRTMICLGTSLGRSRSQYHSHKLRDNHTNSALQHRDYSQISSARARFDRRASSQAHAHGDTREKVIR